MTLLPPAADRQAVTVRTYSSARVETPNDKSASSDSFPERAQCRVAGELLQA
jgi:hypothetical protein